MNDFNRDELRRALRESNKHSNGALESVVRATSGLDFGRSLSRRRFFLAGGATISFAALVAACGGSEKTGIARLGDAPVRNKLVEADVTDIALLRTATSLEHNAIFVYEAAIDAGLLDGDAAEIAKRFLADHKDHAAATAGLTTDLGGNAYNEPNPRLQSIYIEPALKLIVGDEASGTAPTDDPAADVLALAYALETIAGATIRRTCRCSTTSRCGPQPWASGSQEARHAALLGVVLNPVAPGVVVRLVDCRRVPGGHRRARPGVCLAVGVRHAGPGTRHPRSRQRERHSHHGESRDPEPQLDGLRIPRRRGLSTPVH